MSPDAYIPILTLTGGVVAGVVFFGGLYVTTQRIRVARHPASLVLASFFVRMAVVAIGAWLAGTAGSYTGLLAYVAGTIGLRILLVTRVRRRERVEGA